MRLSINTKDVSDDSRGIVYVLEVEIGDRKVVKIGVTRRKIEDRVVEILTSFFKSYRYFPKVYPKRFKTTDDILGKEAELHKHFSDRRYECEHKFSGSTEFFDVPLDEVVEKYEEVVNAPKDK